MEALQLYLDDMVSLHMTLIDHATCSINKCSKGGGGDVFKQFSYIYLNKIYKLYDFIYKEFSMPFSKLQLFKSNICTATRVKVIGKRV